MASFGKMATENQASNQWLNETELEVERALSRQPPKPRSASNTTQPGSSIDVCKSPDPKRKKQESDGETDEDDSAPAPEPFEKDS